MAMENSILNQMEPSKASKYLANLGLGIGIDATSQRPWDDKLAYRVCRIREDGGDVVILDEGGNWTNFSRQVSSESELQGKLCTSVSAPHVPVTIGAGVEMSRKKIQSLKAFGRRLIECKAAICQDSFVMSTPVDPEDFDARLSSWIVDRIRYYATVCKVAREKSSSSEQETWSQCMTKLGLNDIQMKIAQAAGEHESITCDRVKLQNTEGALKQASEPDVDANADHVQKTIWELLVKVCREFVSYFKVTHYVSAIRLGVAEYQVQEMSTEVDEKSASARFAAFQQIEAAASVSSAWKEFSQDTHTRKLGLVNDDNVVQRLAVLDVTIQPITDRVKTPYLRLALQQALMEHIQHYYQDVDHQIKSKHKFHTIMHS